MALLDVQMPEMDGFEVASRMREPENGRELPIIFLTAIHRDECYARRGYAVGAADYITKPFDVDILRARVRLSSICTISAKRFDARRWHCARASATRPCGGSARSRESPRRPWRPTMSESLLTELLRTFLDGSDVAESTVLSCVPATSSRGRDPEPPRVFPRAHVGSVGEGFAGTIAASRRRSSSVMPPEPATHQEWLDKRGASALFGMPLMSEGEVLGVAYSRDESQRALSGP